jgi:polyhydroxybutyrate depolymerase
MLSLRTSSIGVALAVSVLAIGCSGSGSDATGAPATTTAPASTTTASTTTVAPTIPAGREVEIHVPPGYQDGTPAPLLILLHGFGADGKIQSGYLGLQKATDAAGMLYVYPDGVMGRQGKRSWNATDACCARGEHPPDDSSYLAAIIAEAKDRYDVDPDRVYVMGHSNGGFMSYRMACDHADEIAAIASIAGATYDDPAKCTPSEPVATLEIHGTGDQTIRYRGGSIQGDAYPSAPTTTETWAGYDGCSTTPDSPAPADRQIVQDLPAATVTSYSRGCEPGGHAELWTQPQGVHIPAWTEDFSTQVVDWLLAHPKP